MTYDEIPDLHHRCQNSGVLDYADIQQKLLEEIADLRHFIELELLVRSTNWTNYIENRKP